MCWVAAVRRSPLSASALWLAEAAVMLSRILLPQPGQEGGELEARPGNHHNTGWVGGRQNYHFQRFPHLEEMFTLNMSAETEVAAVTSSWPLLLLLQKKKTVLKTARRGWADPEKLSPLHSANAEQVNPKGHEHARQRPREHPELPGKVPFKCLMHGALLWHHRMAQTSLYTSSKQVHPSVWKSLFW